MLDFVALLFGLQVFDIILVFGVDMLWVNLIQSVYAILLAYAMLYYMPKIAKVVQVMATATGQVIRIFRP